MKWGRGVCLYSDPPPQGRKHGAEMQGSAHEGKRGTHTSEGESGEKSIPESCTYATLTLKPLSTAEGRRLEADHTVAAVERA